MRREAKTNTHTQLMFSFWFFVRVLFLRLFVIVFQQTICFLLFTWNIIFLSIEFYDWINRVSFPYRLTTHLIAFFFLSFWFCFWLNWDSSEMKSKLSTLRQFDIVSLHRYGIANHRVSFNKQNDTYWFNENYESSIQTVSFSDWPNKKVIVWFQCFFFIYLKLLVF